MKEMLEAYPLGACELFIQNRSLGECQATFLVKHLTYPEDQLRPNIKVRSAEIDIIGEVWVHIVQVGDERMVRFKKNHAELFLTKEPFTLRLQTKNNIFGENQVVGGFVKLDKWEMTSWEGKKNAVRASFIFVGDKTEGLPFAINDAPPEIREWRSPRGIRRIRIKKHDDDEG